MTNNSATEHTVPAALITHCTAIIRGHHDADITACHARTSDARLTMTWGGVLLTVDKIGLCRICPSVSPRQRS